MGEDIKTPHYAEGPVDKNRKKKEEGTPQEALDVLGKMTIGGDGKYTDAKE